MAIELITFDLMGVIFTEAHIIRNVLFPLLSEPKDYDFVKERYTLYTEGKINNTEFWKSIFRGPHKAFEKRYLDAFHLDPAYETTIAYLIKKYDLAILSNHGVEWVSYLSQKYNFKKLFKHIIISAKVNTSKPDIRIYEALQEESKTPYSHIFFVDDRLNSLKPAAELGMTTAWYKKEDDRFDFKPEYILSSLSELENIL